MATVPKQVPLEQQQRIYAWLKKANPWLPAEEKVAADYLTLSWEAEPHVATIELKLYIDVPSDPFPARLEPFEP